MLRARPGEWRRFARRELRASRADARPEPREPAGSRPRRSLRRRRGLCRTECPAPGVATNEAPRAFGCKPDTTRDRLPTRRCTRAHARREPRSRSQAGPFPRRASRPGSRRRLADERRGLAWLRARILEPSACAIKLVAAFRAPIVRFWFMDRSGFAKTALSTDRRLASRWVAPRHMVSAGHDLTGAGT